MFIGFVSDLPPNTVLLFLLVLTAKRRDDQTPRQATLVPVVATKVVEAEAPAALPAAAEKLALPKDRETLETMLRLVEQVMRIAQDAAGDEERDGESSSF